MICSEKICSLNLSFKGEIPLYINSPLNKPVNAANKDVIASFSKITGHVQLGIGAAPNLFNALSQTRDTNESKSYWLKSYTTSTKLASLISSFSFTTTLATMYCISSASCTSMPKLFTILRLPLPCEYPKYPT